MWDCMPVQVIKIVHLIETIMRTMTHIYNLKLAKGNKAFKTMKNNFQYYITIGMFNTMV